MIAQSAVALKVKHMATNRNRRVVAACPVCGHKLTYKDVKTLWGRATGALSRQDDKEDTTGITVPGIHCDQPLTYAQVKSLWGKATAAMRDTYGAGPGRPKSTDRCPCGLMTRERAEKRKHVCVAPKRRGKA